MHDDRTLLLREAIGETIRDLRMREHRTLREVSAHAQMSLGYLSEIERGQKEASSEVLSWVADALGITVGELMMDVAERLVAYESSSVVSLRERLAA
ncbi:MAG: helix-turn-helix domain-containing protein [Propionibacteriaceae bacterium]|jgi:transcriptional regulator with XRE-family HTH domain|nr:helix-turn-helix domain-containing protein [Propionibacteriaceae bacterium]